MQKLSTILILLLIPIAHLLGQGEKGQDASDTIAKRNMLTTLVQSFPDNATPANAEKIAYRALELARELNDKSVEAKIYLLLGEYFYNQADANLPKKYFTLAFTLAKTISNPSLLMQAQRDIARVNNKEGKYYQAIAHFHSSLEIAQSIRDMGYVFTNLISLSISYNDQNKPLQALSFAKIALKDTQNIPPKYHAITMASLYMCEGKSYFLLDNYSEAEALTKKSLTYIRGESARELKTIGWNYMNLGDIYKTKRRYSEALLNYQYALDAFKKVGGEFGFQRIYIEIAEVYYEQGNFNRARFVAEQALILSRQVGIWLDIKNSAKLLSDIHMQQHSYEQAYLLHKEYTAAKDSILSIEMEENILEIQTKFETKEKENLIKIQQAELLLKDSSIARQQSKMYLLLMGLFAILGIALISLWALIRLNRHKNIILKQQREIEVTNASLSEQKVELEEINESKNRLFSIIGHDLISQVGSTKEFLRLLTEPETNINESQHIKILSALYETSAATYSLLENLLMWSKNERGLLLYSPKIYGVEKVINDALSSQNPLAKKKEITIKTSVPHNLSAAFDFNMIATVLRNLVANAIKFSNRKGVITVTAMQNEGTVSICVSDQGRGMSPHKVEEITSENRVKTTPGTENESGTGLGLTLCFDLVKRHGSKLLVESAIDKGSKFTFSLPTTIAAEEEW